MSATLAPAFTIKVCGITNVHDGQVALNSGANALGFNFYRQSSRYITSASAAAMVKKLEGDYLRVGVFVNATASELENAGAEANLDILQLHGSMPDTLPLGYRIWQAIAAGSEPQPHPRVESYLVDTPSAHFGGSGRTYDWRLATYLSARIILAGGLHAGNVAEAIATARPSGVDACSCLESAPGRKDPQLTYAFIKAALAAQKQLLSLELSV